MAILRLKFKIYFYILMHNCELHT